MRSANSNSGCPTVGAHEKYGKLYTGTYPYKKWQSESVRPHWQEIRDARGDNLRRRARKRKSELETTISELTSKKARTEASISSTATDNSSASISKLGTIQAGNSFGGRSKKSKHPRKIWCFIVQHMRLTVFKLNIAYRTYIVPSHEKIKRRISDIKTSDRRVSSTIQTIGATSGQQIRGRCEMDSHVDTTVAGRNCTIIQYTDRSCDVSPFADKYTPMKDVPIFSAATG